MMFLAILLLMVKYWPLTVIVLVAAGYALTSVARRWSRIAGYLILVLSAPILILMDAALIGCLPPEPGDERCFGHGFGLVLAFYFAVPGSVLALFIGALLPRWFGPDRNHRSGPPHT
jgi:hypothetical protein